LKLTLCLTDKIPITKEFNKIYLFSYGGLFYRDFCANDVDYNELAKLNYNVYVKRMKYTKNQLQKLLNEPDWFFEKYFVPLFENN